MMGKEKCKSFEKMKIVEHNPDGSYLNPPQETGTGKTTLFEKIFGSAAWVERHSITFTQIPEMHIKRNRLNPDKFYH